ncbi:Uncharacterised protein [Candidatus Anstonella stagnisolia]|nr:Uncharacterised protein [Candidatus Anstonella stagnisolia]
MQNLSGKPALMLSPREADGNGAAEIKKAAASAGKTRAAGSEGIMKIRTAKTTGASRKSSTTRSPKPIQTSEEERARLVDATGFAFASAASVMGENHYGHFDSFFNSREEYGAKLNEAVSGASAAFDAAMDSIKTSLDAEQLDGLKFSASFAHLFSLTLSEYRKDECAGTFRSESEEKAGALALEQAKLLGVHFLLPRTSAQMAKSSAAAKTALRALAAAIPFAQAKEEAKYLSSIFPRILDDVSAYGYTGIFYGGGWNASVRPHEYKFSAPVSLEEGAPSALSLHILRLLAVLTHEKMAHPHTMNRACEVFGRIALSLEKLHVTQLPLPREKIPASSDPSGTKGSLWGKDSPWSGCGAMC